MPLTCHLLGRAARKPHPKKYCASANCVYVVCFCIEFYWRQTGLGGNRRQKRALYLVLHYKQLCYKWYTLHISFYGCLPGISKYFVATGILYSWDFIIVGFDDTLFFMVPITLQEWSIAAVQQQAKATPNEYANGYTFY